MIAQMGPKNLSTSHPSLAAVVRPVTLFLTPGKLGLAS